MIRTLQERPLILRGPAAELDALLDGEDADGGATIPGLPEAIAGRAGEILVHESESARLTEHRIVLSRAGSALIRSADGTGEAQLSAVPLPALPGALTRLVRIAPTAPLSPDVRIVPPEGATFQDLFDAEAASRTAHLDELSGSAADAPIGDPGLETAPARAVRTRRSVRGRLRTTTLAQLHGRFLLGDERGLRGTDPTTLVRAIMRTALAVD